MEFFTGARVVRLVSFYGMYLMANEDERRVSVSKPDASDNALWNVEIVSRDPNSPRVRFRSYVNCYLAADASRRRCFRGIFKDQNVFQEHHDGRRIFGEWYPVRDGLFVQLRCSFGDYLRARVGHLIFPNSAMVDRPSGEHMGLSYLWEVHIIRLPEPPPRRPLSQAAGPSGASSSMEPIPSSSTIAPAVVSMEGEASSSPMAAGPSSSTVSPPSVFRDRAFNYVIADDAGKADDPREVLTSRLFRNSTSELTSKLREKTGLDDVYVCARSWRDQSVFVPLREDVPSMLECTHHLVVFNANSRGAYESLAGARVVRLRTIHDKYLTVDDDMHGLRQQHDGSLVRAWWSVESITDNRNQLRVCFQNCFGVDLAAPLSDFSLQRLAGDKEASAVLRQIRGLHNSRKEWALIRVDSRFMVRCNFEDYFLWADPSPGSDAAGTQLPSSSNTLDPFLWYVEILESDAGASSYMVVGPSSSLAAAEAGPSSRA
ncbi:hypothetical protein OPV22_010415 [Ensete ventricosum]|uniref:DUF569 domain-containing protein n=1 Tax=Ensete ventricosum TaxID=4639 RepID=A0AAV8RI83_ENSVE|nr:hypothetical protein OPV22_010415 [Ensete ventricosum]RWW14715.1 hypothetical protein GW17_00021498 [Ensete ventricosum]RWW77249.1 hypothetical protein BHE74_00014599 [Ensete ventricosum]